MFKSIHTACASPRAICLAILIGYIISSASLYADSLYVYLPTLKSVQEMEKVLKVDPALSGFTITVFGKFSELKKQHKASPADALIIPSSFSKFNKGYKDSMQFTLKDKKSFNYLLLSIVKGKNKNQLSTESIGIVDELGRKDTKKYVHRLLGKVKRIKRVTKPDDLMPLLALQNASVILVRPHVYEILKLKYATETFEVSKSIDIPFPVLTVKEGLSADKLEKLKSVSEATIKGLGYSGKTIIGDKK
ncbi:MAG: hypothetical protein HRT89_05940 [Lentisphaeria bacterium]|nr:hypothetical protein [Lentisphaeria bacterium]NQZ67593.1 hypothetical protein [Lentisphaeria bacterium]